MGLGDGPPVLDEGDKEGEKGLAPLLGVPNPPLGDINPPEELP